MLLALQGIHWGWCTLENAYTSCICLAIPEQAWACGFLATVLAVSHNSLLKVPAEIGRLKMKKANTLCFDKPEATSYCKQQVGKLANKQNYVITSQQYFSSQSLGLVRRMGDERRRLMLQKATRFPILRCREAFCPSLLRDQLQFIYMACLKVDDEELCYGPEDPSLLFLQNTHISRRVG
ncbi:hypothetical protein AAHA92_21804 [Salvia divinorum]|uniref:Uncharacterized protein n=1 Tax=Salvia divinorum TaxID=28513 RepID=A0ABD1GLL9_SALDI